MKGKYLPIGTVVLLKDASKKIMITGYCSSTPEDPDTVYDYVAHLFPEGSLAGENVALFNHDQIGDIIHMGLDNEEFKSLDKTIKEAMSISESTDSNEFYNLAPFTPENINLMLEEIKKNGDDFMPVAEPTAFDEAVMKKPVFSLPTLGSDEKKNEVIKEKDKYDIREAEDSADINVGDGKPVLQLQPIFENDSASADPSSESSGGITGLSRL